ncbi:17227_t:CDS:10 [Cetraspora pellucida]|uniref:17227_t:CDS:1 n=1 Tax=Cetraspora pellucida TaxID=1433469 RepID=A0A9N9ASN2_9GLOM|nr:17227_t:CDS:10 [Cetraspora pellucida]
MADTSGEHISDEAPDDSLTLGQLKKIVKQLPNKQKPKEISFSYTDHDSISNEIEEFYSYAEISQCLENKNIFDEGFGETWTICTMSERRVYIEYLLETLELKDPEKRFLSAKKLLYIAQGTFGETTTQEQHLEWIMENNKLLRKCGALLSYFQALKLACHAHDYYSRSDFNVDRQAYIDDINTEIGFYLTLLYMLVETHHGDDSFGAELAELNPPMVVFLFEIIASLREKEKNAKGYPVKKMELSKQIRKFLLLLWKVILASLGGLNDMSRLKNTVRTLNGLPPIFDKGLLTKSTPMDYYTFQNEATQKYPTYVPPPCPFIPTSPIAASLFPSANNHTNGNDSSGQNASSVNGNGNGSQPPKSRKQQFQTNQRQPFIFPFSKSTPSVPKSIQEAGDLYLKFMHISLGTFQCWNERIEMKKLPTMNITNSISFNENDVRNQFTNNEDEFQNKIAKMDKEKIERIEILYKSILPHLQNIVIMLLKLLLATVSNNKNSDNDKGGTSVNNDHIFENTINYSTSNGNTIEEIDIMRHREITSKAVSAIILLMLKHLKLSHILKFEYLSQLLVDSNCLLLILKMFGLQDVSLMVKAKNEVENMNFFQYCMSINNDTNEMKLADNNMNVDNQQEHSQAFYNTNQSDQSNDSQSNTSNENDIDSDYCWRNFFAAINFLKILQKLTKRKTHRILLLVQYKSSAILKRILKVSHPLLELYALKVLKNQIPFIGRKWRQSNMKVITSIYLSCRPDLRDEWISSTDVDAEMDDALAKQNLRTLIKFYNERNYFPQCDQQDGMYYDNSNRNLPDIFPPCHTKSLNHVNYAYIPDDIMLDDSFPENWEQWLQEEVYSFSIMKPHLKNIDEYYDDDFATLIPNGDGSEWDMPPTSPVDGKDPFSSIEWKNISSYEIKALEQRINNNGFKFFDFDDMGTNNSKSFDYVINNFLLEKYSLEL